MGKGPVEELDARFSEQDADPTSWTEARRALEDAELYWLTTVRSDGRPHVTPLIAVWLDDALCFTTGPSEQKAQNLAADPRCILTTGCNALNEGLDLVVEGEAVEVRDEAALRHVGDAYEAKYRGLWHPASFWEAFGRPQVAGNDDSIGTGGPPDTPLVFRLEPSTIFGFGKTVPSQTRWRFDRP